jgi:acyl dehydratase
VRANDQLRLTSTITQVRTSASRPELGIVHWHWRLVNQSDVTVLEVDATSLFDLSPA